MTFCYVICWGHYYNFLPEQIGYRQTGQTGQTGQTDRQTDRHTVKADLFFFVYPYLT